MSERGPTKVKGTKGAGSSGRNWTERPSRTGEPVDEFLHNFLVNVLEGKKSNRALHAMFRSPPIRPERKELLAGTCNGTLRLYHLIASEIGSSDPMQIAAAGTMLFSGRPGKGLRMEKRRFDAIRVRTMSSDPLNRVLKARRPEKVPQKAILASSPDWLKDLLSSSLGEDFRHVLADSLLPPRYIGLRANALITGRGPLLEELGGKGIKVVKSELDPYALLAPDGTPIDSLLAYRDGRLEVQDLSSQVTCRLALSGTPMGRVVDACAGNGGKTLAFAALMRNKGSLISMDTNERSLARLRQRGRRAQVWNYQRVLVRGERDLEPYRRWADVVLVDAPCSGLGTLRRNPDIKLHLTREAVERFPSLQLDLLMRYSGSVRDGGRLVYSTCTLNRSENQGVVNAFLEKSGNFSLLDLGKAVPEVPRDMLRGPFFYPLPSDEHSGFFAAVMVMGG